jgi:hypothetical protein
VRLALGFSHWFGPTLGSPDGVTTPAVAVGVRPGLSFLEMCARYAVSLEPIERDEVPGRVGFLSLEVVASREMRAGNQTLLASVGPFGLLDHAGGSLAGGYGVVFDVEYLFETGLPGRIAMGIFLATRVVYYALPGEERDLLGDARRDAQIDLGLVATIF